MGDMLSSATSGLLAFQRALDTTSHNIANVNTDGYSRQRVEIGTRTPQAFSTGFVGSGADVNTIERLYDRFMAEQTRSSSSQLERLNTYSAQADQLDNLFANDQTGLSASLQKFINAFQDVANSPSSIPARQVVLAQAQSFRDQLQTFDSRLTEIDKNLNSRLSDEAKTVTSLAQNIAELNRNIAVDQARTGQPPNDLLDQRDKLLDQLSTHLNVQVATQDDGTVLVSIGGQPLVVGTQAASLVAIQDPYDASRNSLAVQNVGVPVDVGSRLSGGSLGGLLDFRRDLLDPTRNSLGQLSLALAEQVNNQNKAGIDLNGNFGQDIFNVGGVNVLARTNNAGTGAVAVTRQQPSAGAITGADYYATFTASGWALRRADTGATVTMTGAGTAGSPFLADGLSIVVSGTPTIGDSFLVRPTRSAISGMNVLLSDPKTIAAAAPISTTTNNGNTGSGKISAGEVLNVANGALLTPVSLQFNSATTYQVNGAGPSIAYTPGANIDINGWRVVISGAPAVGDSFAVGPNNNPAGDNRNALKISDALSAGVLDAGQTSLNAGAGQLVGKIGVAASQAQANRDAQQTIHDDDVRTKDSVSGVNLDEEAGNLLRFQQAYQAAAQAIKIADTLFQTVLDATRR
jgi:flagellar hook-associated protein 1 FlgK